VKRIAFVTCSIKPDFADDDLETVRLLRKQGISVHPIPWDNDQTDWQTFDKVIIRSCWNYHLHPEQFIEWLNNLEAKRVNLHNPINVVRWNMDKSYLQTLSQQGVPIPPTAWLTKGTSLNLASFMEEKSWQKAVVKPAISATAHNTFVTTLAEVVHHQEVFDTLLQQSDLLVQQFMDEVQKAGEWSLIFINKKFSHAVLKRPAANDFRVQDNFGGTSQSYEPPTVALQQAEKILDFINEPLLYARVDGIISNDQFLLMELELIEPMLFLGHNIQAANTLAREIILCLV
jgi:glutathione synthase/RimK-type ligase-like ATP-grasp enzyme